MKDESSAQSYVNKENIPTSQKFGQVVQELHYSKLCENLIKLLLIVIHDKFIDFFFTRIISIQTQNNLTRC